MSTPGFQEIHSQRAPLPADLPQKHHHGSPWGSLAFWGVFVLEKMLRPTVAVTNNNESKVAHGVG